MDYATTVNKEYAGDNTVSLPFWVSPTDFPLRIRTKYLEPNDSLELLLDFQRGHEIRVALKMQPIEMEVGKETGRVYRCIVHEFSKKHPFLKNYILLHEFREVVDRENEKNTFLFCLEALTQVLGRETKRNAHSDNDNELACAAVTSCESL